MLLLDYSLFRVSLRKFGEQFPRVGRYVNTETLEDIDGLTEPSTCRFVFTFLD